MRWYVETLGQQEIVRSSKTGSLPTVRKGTHTVLVAEDEPGIGKGLEINLRNEGYEVIRVNRGEKCVSEAIRHQPHAIILDVMLPDMNGFDVCRELRNRGVESAIIMLTVRGSEVDRVVGLEIGADDYVTKPFSLRELLARIRAHVRRLPANGADISLFRFNDVELDFTRFQATRRGRDIELTTKEFELLRFLVKHRGEVVTREQLLELVWGYESSPTTRTIDNHILKLRHKLEPDPARPRFILSVYGEGYRFVG